jgi:hypothetical protein
MGERRGKGWRLNPLPLAQLWRSQLPAPPRTLSACGNPSCCGDAPRCTPSSTPRSSAVHRTGSETSSRPGTLPAAVRESFPRAHSVSASPAEYALTQSAVLRTTPGNADWSIGQLRPVVAADRLRLSALRHDRIQHSRHPPAGKARVHFQGQAFARIGSTTLSTRIARPHATASCAKSSAHSWFAEVRASSGCPTRAQCLRFLRRIISPVSR